MRPAGLIASLRGVLVSVLGIAGTRIELIGLEVAEEKERLVGLLFTVLAAAFALSLAVLLVTFLVIAHFWDSYRLTAIGGFALLYAAVGGWLITGLKRELAAHPPLVFRHPRRIGKRPRRPAFGHEARGAPGSMNPRLEQLQLRKEALMMRAELERIELAQHLSALRRPAEMSYKGLRLVSLLRVPVTALLANRFGNTAPAGMLGQVARLCRLRLCRLAPGSGVSRSVGSQCGQQRRAAHLEPRPPCFPCRRGAGAGLSL